MIWFSNIKYAFTYENFTKKGVFGRVGRQEKGKYQKGRKEKRRDNRGFKLIFFREFKINKEKEMEGLWCIIIILFLIKITKCNMLHITINFGREGWIVFLSKTPNYSKI